MGKLSFRNFYKLKKIEKLKRNKIIVQLRPSHSK